jgi:hypothetical protein
LQPWSYGRLNTVERALLAQRIQGEQAKSARHLNDLLRLQPPDMDRFLMLFDTALGGSALETEGQKAFGRPMLEKSAAPRAPESAPAAPAGAAGATRSDAPAAEFRSRGGKDAAKPADELQQRKANRALKEAAEAGLRALDRAGEADEKLGEKLHYFGDDRTRPGLAAQLYRKVDPTQEFAENNYYHLPIQQQTAGLVSVSDFWLDYAKHDGKSPFLSRHLAEASRNFAEAMMALAVLDLPAAAQAAHRGSGDHRHLPHGLCARGRRGDPSAHGLARAGRLAHRR